MRFFDATSGFPLDRQLDEVDIDVDRPLRLVDAFLHAWTMALRAQLAGTPVRVVELHPPVTDTPMAHGVETPLTPMPPERVAAALLRGLERGDDEVAPGVSSALRWSSRLAPSLTFRLLNR